MLQNSGAPHYLLKDLGMLSNLALRDYLTSCLDPVPDFSNLDQDASPLLQHMTSALDCPAAILVPFLRVRKDWHILMTRRAAHLVHHPGQISFPGGKVEPSDASPAATALREAFEEVQLTPDIVQVVGSLGIVRSPAGFLVQPIVGIIDGKNPLKSLLPDPAEVDLLFTMPLKHLVNPDNFRLVPRETDGRRNDYWVVNHDEHLIWGLSATVLKDLHRRFGNLV